VVIGRQDTVWKITPAGVAMAITAYKFKGTMPPDELVTSIRGLTLKNQQVLLLENRSGSHILPGGRRNDGENYEETLMREIREETGYEISNRGLIAILHLHTDDPSALTKKLPDFFQLVYLCEALEKDPSHHGDLDDGFEESCELVAIKDVVDVPEWQRKLLDI
jgi:ADP-ribose pyrophosphatase YjhB (NUDIX family)